MALNKEQSQGLNKSVELIKSMLGLTCENKHEMLSMLGLIYLSIMNGILDKDDVNQMLEDEANHVVLRQSVDGENCEIEITVSVRRNG